MAVQLWEALQESITAYTGLSPISFFTAIVVGIALYQLALTLFASSTSEVPQGHGDFEDSSQPLPPPVQLGEITEDELKRYDGSDPNKPLLMAIKGQIFDVTQSKMFYGPGGPYSLFSGKDASRALAKMSFEDKDLNGDLTGLGVFELEALQGWEYKFTSKYVKVGTIKATVETDAAKTNGDVAKPEDGPSEIEETATAGHAERDE